MNSAQNGHASPHAIRLTIPAKPEYITLGRLALTGIARLRAEPLSQEVLGDLKLALTEACTNVLKHAKGGSGEYQVDFEIDESQCNVSVADAGVGFNYGSSRHQAPYPVAESGRGLHLMSVLVDDLKFMSKPGVAGTVVHLSKALDLTDRSLLHSGRSR
jgi:serine/threonine-protein kinase RsbW